MDSGKVRNLAPVALRNFAGPPRKNELLKVCQPQMDKRAVFGSLGADRLRLSGSLRSLLARPEDCQTQHVEVVSVLFVMEKPRRLAILAVHASR
jgi:hypothetical protein